MKIIALFLLTFTALTSGWAQNSSPEEREAAAVKTVMKAYKDALQNLTTEGTFELFSPDSKVYEQGGVEGSYRDYIDHHLGPELGHFNSFSFKDYTIEVEVSLPYAFTTETYIYEIELNEDAKGGARTIERKGVATSVLRKQAEGWKIIKTHSSSRAVK